MYTHQGYQALYQKQTAAGVPQEVILEEEESMTKLWLTIQEREVMQDTNLYYSWKKEATERLHESSFVSR